MCWFKENYEICVVDKVFNREFVGMYNVYIVIEDICELKSVCEIL